MSVWTTATRFAVNFRSRNEGKLVFTLSAEARLLTFAECDRLSIILSCFPSSLNHAGPWWIEPWLNHFLLAWTRMTHWLSLQHWCREGSALVWPGSLSRDLWSLSFHPSWFAHPSPLYPRPTGYDHYGKDIKRRSNRWSFVPALRRSCTKHLRPWLGPTCPEHKAWQTTWIAAGFHAVFVHNSHISKRNDKKI